MRAGNFSQDDRLKESVVGSFRKAAKRALLQQDSKIEAKDEGRSLFSIRNVSFLLGEKTVDPGKAADMLSVNNLYGLGSFPCTEHESSEEVMDSSGRIGKKTEVFMDFGKREDASLSAIFNVFVWKEPKNEAIGPLVSQEDGLATNTKSAACSEQKSGDEKQEKAPIVEKKNGKKALKVSPGATQIASAAQEENEKPSDSSEKTCRFLSGGFIVPEIITSCQDAITRFLDVGRSYSNREGFLDVIPHMPRIMAKDGRGDPFSIGKVKFFRYGNFYCGNEIFPKTAAEYIDEKKVPGIEKLGEIPCKGYTSLDAKNKAKGRLHFTFSSELEAVLLLHFPEMPHEFVEDTKSIVSVIYPGATDFPSIWDIYPGANDFPSIWDISPSLWNQLSCIDWKDYCIEDWKDWSVSMKFIRQDKMDADCDVPNEFSKKIPRKSLKRSSRQRQ